MTRKTKKEVLKLRDEVITLKHEPLLATEEGKKLVDNIDILQNSINDISDVMEKNTGKLDILTEWRMQKKLWMITKEYQQIHDALEVIKEMAAEKNKPKEAPPAMPQYIPPEQKPHLLDEAPEPEPMPVKKKSFIDKIIAFFRNLLHLK